LGGGGLEGREGSPFRAAFGDNQSDIGKSPGRMKGEQAVERNRAGGLVLGVDVVVS